MMKPYKNGETEQYSVGLTQFELRRDDFLEMYLITTIGLTGVIHITILTHNVVIVTLLLACDLNERQRLRRVATLTHSPFAS